MRKALVIGALVVVALVAVLWLAIEKDTAGSSDTASAGSAAPVPPPTATGSTPDRPQIVEGTTGPAPTLPEVAEGKHPRDYVVGEIRVRDHRAGDNAPLDIPPNPHPAEGRKIPSTLTHAVAQNVKAVMMQCVENLPKEARGEKPRLEGQISIAIKDHKVTVTKSTMHLRNMSGAAVEPAKQCIEQNSIGLENSAPDQADLDDYSINISFAIP